MARYRKRTKPNHIVDRDLSMRRQEFYYEFEQRGVCWKVFSLNTLQKPDPCRPQQCPILFFANQTNLLLHSTKNHILLIDTFSQRSANDNRTFSFPVE